ncbi:lipoprotein signal peptidase [Membranihabitans maritimus]|uniref:lipoprotein signal peptidase n=1 Tax=Membranihabitans maritimus TaxID=2904244 RepID=UPI001F031453|nr:lipoprotein signal peptidase [Membranihabitans maritimus]
MKKSTISILVIVGVLLVDQVVKFVIKTNMYYHQQIPILGQDWAFIHFVENNGMAFGISLGENYGKLALSIFRIITVIGLGWLINSLLKKKERFGLIVALCLIFAGAMGNIIDSVFYGVIFSDSGFVPSEIATFLPPEGGYSSFLHGKVVDMFYFPMIDTVWPSWVPIIGGNSFQFFRPVFNVADSSICIGMFTLLIFYRDFFSGGSHKKAKEVQETANTD